MISNRTQGVESTSQHWYDLIESFAIGSLSTDLFERQFLSLWNAQNWSLIPDDVSEIITELFYNVDAYCGDPALYQEGDLDAESLRESAIRALDALHIIEAQSF